MNSAVWTLLAVLAAASIPDDGRAQASTATVKRYPWDRRPVECLQSPAKTAGKCLADDWPTFWEAVWHVNLLVADPDVDLLERAEKELGFSTRRFATGQYFFDAWFLGLDTQLYSPAEPEYRMVNDWAKAKGEGGYVKIVEALLRYSEAWKARGPGYPNTVTREGWDIYERKLREADQTLDSASDLVKRTGPWYVMKLRIAYQLPELEGSRASLLRAGSGSWPEYVRVYATAMTYSSPAWGGTYAEIDRIARLAVTNTRAKWGASYYPLVYQGMQRSNCGCDVVGSHVDWNLMKKGFRDYEARSQPDQLYFAFSSGAACSMRDRPETRRLLDLADKLNPKRRVGPPDPCREFAYPAT